MSDQATAQTLTERIVRREQLLVGLGLAGLTLLAWLYVLLGAGTGMSTLAMSTWQFPPPKPAMSMAGDWNAAYWLTMLAMWWVMMIAMMIPSAAPMILLYARVFRRGQSRGQISGTTLVPTAAFAAGYLACWLAFSVLATALQFALEQVGLVHGMLMRSTDRWLTAGLLIAAGVFQLSPLKATCLAHCRSPAEFLSRHWREGRLGAFRLGIVHGAYCLGCCWALMLLLFAAGIMNLVWIAGLAVLVLIEKLAPFGARLSPAIAAALIAAGLYVAVT
jgi:predicted metal-binding membrane protein